MFIVSLLVTPWLRRVTYLPLAARVQRMETLFWCFVIQLALIVLMACLYQVISAPPAPPDGPLLGPSRVVV
jgi:hypothetical protein